MATAKKPAAADPSDSGEAEIQAKFDEAEAKGFFGHTPDETPNENYTLAGVVKGLPTPENHK